MIIYQVSGDGRSDKKMRGESCRLIRRQFAAMPPAAFCIPLQERSARFGNLSRRASGSWSDGWVDGRFVAASCSLNKRRRCAIDSKNLALGLRDPGWSRMITHHLAAFDERGAALLPWPDRLPGVKAGRNRVIRLGFFVATAAELPRPANGSAGADPLARTTDSSAGRRYRMSMVRTFVELLFRTERALQRVLRIAGVGRVKAIHR